MAYERCHAVSPGSARSSVVCLHAVVMLLMLLLMLLHSPQLLVDSLILAIHAIYAAQTPIALSPCALQRPGLILTWLPLWAKTPFAPCCVGRRAQSHIPTDWLLLKPYSLPCRLPHPPSFRQVVCYRRDADADMKVPVLATCVFQGMLPRSPSRHSHLSSLIPLDMITDTLQSNICAIRP
jgi:hypothetical protein